MWWFIGYGTQGRRQVTSAISSVKAEDIKNIPIPSIDNILQGRAAGVQVTQSSGQPGGGISVRIRGNTSIQGGNDPLYVVDGIPIQSNSLDRLSDGGSGSNPLADINPSDIESIQILKDAAATSIYGARAANGVVLISTKRGKAGTPSIQFNTYYGMQEITHTLSQINAQQYREYLYESYANSGRDIRITGDGLRATDSLNYNADFYWQGALFQRAPIANYDLSISGGQDKINYFVSGSFFDQDGIMLNSKYKRYAGRANIEYRPTDKFKIGNTITYSRSLSNRVSEESRDSRGVIYRTLTRQPTESPYDNQGNIRPDNPISTLVNSFQRAGSHRLIGSIFGELQVLPDLIFRSSFSIDYLALKEDRFFPSSIFSFGGAQRTGAVEFNQQLGWINENTLTYAKQFGEHNITVLAGLSKQKNTNEGIYGRGSRYSTDLIPTLNAAAQRDDLGTFETAYGLASYYTRLNYDYKGKYIAGFTARYDGSSRFGKENRYGFFPSLSVGWLLSEENFLKEQTIISELKLRASIGRTGNQSISNFGARGLLITGTDYLGFGGVSPAGNGLPNPNLSWESTVQSNVGFDLSFLHNRFRLVIDYYTKKTHDLLFNQPISTITGYSSVLSNLGSIQNKGIEFEITSNNFNTGDFRWSTSANVAFNRNKVISLPGGKDIITARGILREGEPLGSFYGFQQLRVFPTDADNVNNLRLDNQTGSVFGGGDVEFLDVNKDNVINNSDRVILGNANPDFTGGLSNKFAYKGVDLTVFFNFSYGNDIFNEVRRDRDSHRLGNGAGSSTDVLKRWRQPGDITDVPKIYVGDERRNGRTNSSYWMEDGSYVRLKNVSLGYTIPSAFGQRVKVKSARIYATGQNLLTFTRYSGFDPEVVNTGSNANANPLEYGVDIGFYPLAKSLIFGINLGF